MEVDFSSGEPRAEFVSLIPEAGFKSIIMIRTFREGELYGSEAGRAPAFSLMCSLANHYSLFTTDTAMKAPWASSLKMAVMESGFWRDISTLQTPLSTLSTASATIGP